MKAVLHISIIGSDGKPQSEETKEGKQEYTMSYLLKRMIDLTKYSDRSEQKKADAIYDKIKITKHKGKDVLLFEDESLELLKNLANKFDVFKNGRSFVQLFDALDDAEDVEVAPKK